MHEDVPSRLEMGPGADVASSQAPGSPDPIVAKLLAALRARPGHILVTGETANAAQALFTEVERQLPVYCSVRVSGRSLDPDAVVLGLWRTRESADASLRRHQMVQMLVEDARAAGLPILVVISDADAADAGQLELVRRALEGVPDATEVVRIILLGGPRVGEVLARPEARALATRIVASVHAPLPSAPPATVAAISNVRPPQPQPTGSRLPLVAVLGVLTLLALWMVLRPTAEVPPAPVASVEERGAEEVGAPAARTEGAPQPEGAPLEAAAPVVPEPAVPHPGAPIVETRAQPAAPSPAHARSLQVGAFLAIDNAAALRERLAAQYHDVYLSPVDRDGKTFYRVRVGGFADDAALAAATKTLREAGYAPIRVRD